MADRGFPAPHDGFCDLCSKPIVAGDRVCLLGWSEWAHKTCVDARPVSIPLPPEPPHDRVVEAVGVSGKLVKRWRWTSHEPSGWISEDDGEWWQWSEIVMAGMNGLTLRHVAAESGEQT